MAEIVQASRARRALRDGTFTQLRVSAKLSQGDVARAIGVSSGAVSKWESGAATPRTALAVKLASLISELKAASP